MTALIICVLLVAADQLTKLAAVNMLREMKSVKIIEGFFNLTYLENRGAAFGMLEGGKWLFLAVTAAVVALMVTYYVKMEKNKNNMWLRCAIVMIVSGAVGNAIDRLFRGYVVDFFDFIVFGYNFPVFNVADILVVIGTALLAGGIILFDGIGKEKG